MTLHAPPRGAPSAAAPPGDFFEETFSDGGNTPVVSRATASGDTWEYDPLGTTFVTANDFQATGGGQCGRATPADNGGASSGGWWYDTGSDAMWMEIDLVNLNTTGTNIQIGWALGYDQANKASQRFFGMTYGFQAGNGWQLGFWYVSGEVWTFFPQGGAGNILITQAQTMRCVLTVDDPGPGRTLTVTPLAEPGLEASYSYSGFGSEVGTRAGFVYGYRFTSSNLFGTVRMGAGTPP